MKIAAVSEDGVTISQHFGRALFYIVLTIENNIIVSKERREKMGHNQFAGAPHAEGDDPRGHGFDSTAQSRHAAMAAAIGDCQFLLARGMGAGAYESMKAAGIQPIITEISTIEAAVQALLNGTLINHIENLH